ncbi:MAG: PrsW family glutamic-type intramembrane protease [Clostridia bacterium]|nr:PrsW family glutamic-type intramembrane protease [Clostridia bacterium]
MDNLIYILFFCIVAPLTLMLFLLEKKSRLVVGFMIIGICMCIFVAEINGLLLGILGKNIFYITTTVTPITEEIVKALPVLFFAFVFSDKRETLLSISMAVGIGFAILENSYILVSNIDTISIGWSLIRGFGAGLMHGICTAAVGYGISFVRKRKKLFYTGTFALLSAAIIYHATYNCLVQSNFKYAGFLLPLLTYIPIVIALIKRRKKTKSE